jgi:hypothetical protein
LGKDFSISEIVQEWYLNLWKVDRPNTSNGRFECYLRLFETIKQHGYARDDWSFMEERNLLEYTVNPRKGTPKADVDRWTKAAKQHIAHAINQVYGARIKIAAAPATKPAPQYANADRHEADGCCPTPEETAAEPPKKKYKQYVPDEKALEEIDRNFKFEFTDDDLFTDEEPT